MKQTRPYCSWMGFLVHSARNTEAYKAIQQAIALARHAGEQERAYIKALAARYAADLKKADRKTLDHA